MTPKNPQFPTVPLDVTDDDLVEKRVPLWRIHNTSGPYPSPWNELRSVGPLDQFRWEPHPDPFGNHPERAVAYASPDFTTAIAEKFQHARRVDPYTNTPYATLWSPTRPLLLLDLADEKGTGWLIRHHASHSLQSALRRTCRNWARQIAQEHPMLDGLWVVSTMTGQPTVALFKPASSSYPPAATRSVPLSASGIYTAAKKAADQIGYTFVVGRELH